MVACTTSSCTDRRWRISLASTLASAVTTVMAQAQVPEPTRHTCRSVMRVRPSAYTTSRISSTTG